MEKYWTEDQLQPEGLPESLAKLIPEQELALTAWVADWLASPQSWSVYWTKPDYFYVLPTEANIRPQSGEPKQRHQLHLCIDGDC